MKFVHEFIDYPNHKDVDNGWWEFDEKQNRCINSMGGWHSYHPHPKDEFIEGTWDDVIVANLKMDKDNHITGWISPEGDFFGCAPQDHYKVATYIYGCSERELEDKGFVKIYELPFCMRDISEGYGYSNRYGYFGRPTMAQQDVLDRLGLEKT